MVIDYLVEDAEILLNQRSMCCLLTNPQYSCPPPNKQVGCFTEVVFNVTYSCITTKAVFVTKCLLIFMKLVCAFVAWGKEVSFAAHIGILGKAP